MATRDSTGDTRRDAQSVEIALALVTGVVVFLGLVVPVAVLGHVLGLQGAGWVRAGQVGIILAAAAGLTSLVGVVVRARHRGL